MNRRNIKVYPAGPIQGATISHSMANIENGNMWTARIFQLGFSPFPVFSDEQFLRKVRPIPAIGDIYNYSLEWLKVADVMFLIDGWDKSVGAKHEKAVAEQYGIPVFFDLVDMCAWADAMINKDKALIDDYVERVLRESDE